jgi:protein gp37
MAENSGIEWTHHTFNPWIGCTKVSAACDHCYAEAWDARGMQGLPSRWGPHADRTRTKTWASPVKWNREAGKLGIRYRVFCASLADVFDNHKSILPDWRASLWSLIAATPHLDWLLLTKRPQNIAKMLPPTWGNGWPNVWLGTSTENREEMLRRGASLAQVPARIRFWSAEPLVGDLGPIPPEIMPSWIITGGESGSHYRPVNPDWFRSIRDQAASAKVPFLFKQWEGRSQREIKAKGRELDGVVHDGYPSEQTAPEP